MATRSSPRVFVSYSHDSESHKARVFDLVQRLRTDGIDAWSDHFETSPPQGWPRWMQTEVEKADFVVLVCTATYRTRFEGRAEPGTGRGVTWEGLLATQLLYGGELDHARVFAVVFDRHDIEVVPLAARPGSSWVLDVDYPKVLGHLRGIAAFTPVPLGSPPEHEGMPEQMSPLDQLAVLKQQLEAKSEAGADTSELRAAILDLRRQIRDGPSLLPEETLLGRYRLKQIVGDGGFATVWRAFDMHKLTNVAVKVLHGHHLRDASSVDRFAKGAERMATLSHPGVVGIIHEVEVHDDHHHFFVMKWCAGGDLRMVSDAKVSLSAIADALDGLIHAHERGLVHRDVKPGNILLDEAGRGLISDFDLVRAEGSTDGTRTGAGMGSFVYAAPEQLQAAAQVDARADVYGAAMTVAYALTGKDPPLLPLLTHPAYVGALPCGPELWEVLRGALAYDREQRSTTCARLAAAIRAEVARPVDVAVAQPTPAPVIGGPIIQMPATRPVSGSLIQVPTTRLATSRPTWVQDLGKDEYGHWRSFRLGPVEQRMRWIEAGSFTMGSPADEPERNPDEGPQHQVTISRGFWLADTPCTQELWAIVMGDNPSSRMSPLWPVTSVSWNDVRAFLVKLDALLPSFGAVLPTEAQWEYACRAGTSEATYARGGETLGDIAWFMDNSGGRLHDVGTLRCNPWGLHDMLGNVWEWCVDGKRDYRTERVGNPSTPLDESARPVVRGGGYWDTAQHVRAACRRTHRSGSSYRRTGFRLAGTRRR
jgi:formylglycine-generating enzyme required for sulfatase activity